MSVNNQTKRKTEIRYFVEPAAMLSSCGLILRCSLCAKLPHAALQVFLLLHPLFHRISWDYTENRTVSLKLTLCRGKRESSWPFFGFRTQPHIGIRRKRTQCSNSTRFCKLCKTTKPFLTSLFPQNAISCLTMRTRALANRTNNTFLLNTPAKQHLSL